MTYGPNEHAHNLARIGKVPGHVHPEPQPNEHVARRAAEREARRAARGL